MGRVLDSLQVVVELAGHHQPAVVSETNALSYQALANRVSELASWLVSLDAQVLALHTENSIDWIVIDLACQEASIICVPLPTFFSPEQITHCLAQTNIDLLISDKSTTALLTDKAIPISQPSVLQASLFIWQVLNPPSAPQPAGAVILLPKAHLPKATQKITFTSGSTGSPKGVCLSFDHQWQVAQSLADAICINKPKHLCLLPLSTLLENIAGIYAPLLSGGTAVVASDHHRGLSGSSELDTPVFLAFIHRMQPDSLILLPQLLSVLVAACQQGWKPPRSLKFVAVGGARVAPSLIAEARSYQIPVYQGYGLSECGSVVTLNTKNHDNPDSAGHVLPHCQVSTQEGEVVVSNACHLGYLGDEKSWYPSQVNTGDIGSLHKGFLTIRGRKKNTLITTYGRNVSPEWIESELMSTPLLSQCMVIGDGQAFLSALISASNEVCNDDMGHWLQQVNERLPDYAQIKQWRRVDQSCWQKLTTANGRLRRKAVNEAFKNEIKDMYANPALASLPETVNITG